MTRSGSIESIENVKGLVDLTQTEMPEKDYILFRDLVYQKSGIYLGPFKKTRLVWKLGKRMKELNIPTFKDYYEFVLENAKTELKILLESICTHETHFFREPLQMEFLEKQLIPQWRQQAGQKPRSIRIWSAGCSSGEEPYTLAMLLLRYFPRSEGWDPQVLATDISFPVLEKARAGVWSMEKSHEIPHDLLKSYMLRGVNKQQGRIAASDELREIITFRVLNLHEQSYGVQGTFDCIFCRNVLIYFSAQSKEAVIDRLLNYLQPGGYLFLGHAESLHSHPRVTRGPVPAVYMYTGGSKP